MKKLFCVGILFFTDLFIILFLFISPSLALSIDTVYPSLGEVGKTLDVTITGEGFLSNSRVSMSLDTRNRMNLINSLEVVPAEPWNNEANEVKVVGNSAYVTVTHTDSATGSVTGGSLLVIDITNPTNLEIVKSIDTPGPANAVVVKGNNAYVADGIYGLQIINIDTETIEKTVDTGGTANDVDLMDDYALIAQDDYGENLSDGLRVIDISNSKTASVVSSLTIDMCGKVAADSSIVYLSETHSSPETEPYPVNLTGIRIVNFKNPLMPQKNGFILTPSNSTTYDLVAKDHYVYVADGIKGLQIIDASNPWAPTVAGSFNTSGTARGVTFEKDKVYIADEGNGLVVVDTADPENPALASEIITPKYPVYSAPSPNCVAVSGSLSFVLDRYSGLHVIDVTYPAPMTLTGFLNFDDGASNVSIEGNMAYITVNEKNNIGSTIGAALLAYDVSEPGEPVPKGSVDLSVIPSDMVINNNTAFIVGGEKLLLVDVNTMSSPVEVSLPAGDSAVAVKVVGDKAYVACDHLNSDPDSDPDPLLYVIELVNGPDYLKIYGPASINDTHLSTNTTSLDVVNDIAYVTRYWAGCHGMMCEVIGYLFRIDVSNPKNPFVRGTGTGEDYDYDVLNAANDIIVQGTVAYVTDARSLEIIDVSDPDKPVALGTWSEIGSGASSVLAIDAENIYVTDGRSRILVIDITDSASPILVGAMDMRGIPDKGVISQGNAFVVDKELGLTIAPVPVGISPETILAGNQIKATLPSALLAGNYTVRVYTEGSSAQLTGAVTFTGEMKLFTSKAIIVAGGGNFVGNNIWEETKAYTNYAYDNLVFQGYRHEDILYLTGQPDPLGDRYDPDILPNPSNVQPATWLNLKKAITEWALEDFANGQPTSDLLIYMADHGNTEEFVMQGGASPEIVTADELDQWIDTLQEDLPGKVILIYDACRSGSFISRLTPPAGKDRITLTSTTSGQAAYFLSNDHSFSSHFWSTFSGKSGNRVKIGEAFSRASENMSSYQTAQLDSNGNGVPNETGEDGDFTALEEDIVTYYALRRQYNYSNNSKPVVGKIESDDTASVAGSATLRVQDVYDVDGDSITSVWAEIYTPDFNGDQSALTIDGSQFQPFPLSGPDSNGVYQGVKTGFTVNGTYVITYYAEDESGIYSLPRTSLVTQTGGNVKIIPDLYEDDNGKDDDGDGEYEDNDSDDTPAQAKVITLNSPTPQNHSFHVSGDEDWVVFYGIGGEFYNIKASNPTIISDPVIDIFSNSDLVNPVMSSNTAGSGEDETIIGWNPELPFGQGKLPDGEGELYYVRITNSSTNPHYGANVRYKLQIYTPIAPTHPGMVAGRIISGGVGVGGAIIRVGTATAITASDGTFILHLMPGSYSVSVSSSGYQSIVFPVTVISGDVVSYPGVDMNSIPHIINVPPPTIEANKEYSFTPVVIDVDGDPLSYSITGKPSWADFNTTTGRLWGTPGGSSVGHHGPVRISVTDTAGAVDSIEFTVVVVSNPVGSLPSIYMLLLRP